MSVTLEDYQRQEVAVRRVLERAAAVLRDASLQPGEEPVGLFLQDMARDRALEILREAAA